MRYDGNGARMDTTYTFIWAAPQPNPLNLWAQHFTVIAHTVHEALQSLLEQTADKEWGPREGTGVLIVAGDMHRREYARLVPARSPLKLDLPPGSIVQ